MDTDCCSVEKGLSEGWGGELGEGVGDLTVCGPVVQWGTGYTTSLTRFWDSLFSFHWSAVVGRKKTTS